MKTGAIIALSVGGLALVGGGVAFFVFRKGPKDAPYMYGELPPPPPASGLGAIVEDVSVIGGAIAGAGGKAISNLGKDPTLQQGIKAVKAYTGGENVVGYAAKNVLTGGLYQGVPVAKKVISKLKFW